jgi:leucine dehydrogenase
MEVARLVAEDGATLIASDIDDACCRTAADELGAHIVDADDALATPSDVFAPCATGDVIDMTVARDIETKVVAGAANNVLYDELAGEILAARRIIFAPDFVANVGGAIYLLGREALGWTGEQITQKVEAIGSTLEEVFARAKADRISAERAARRLAEDRLASPSAYAPPSWTPTIA